MTKQFLRASILAIFFSGMAGNLTTKSWCKESIIKETERQSVIVFAAKEIPKGSILKREDLCESVINSRGIKARDIPCLSSILGGRLKYTFHAGQVIFMRDLILSQSIYEKILLRRACLLDPDSFRPKRTFQPEQSLSEAILFLGLSPRAIVHTGYKILAQYPTPDQNAEYCLARL